MSRSSHSRLFEPLSSLSFASFFMGTLVAGCLFVFFQSALAEDFQSETKQGTVCISNGSYNQAEKHFKKALNIAKEQSSSRYGDYATSLLNLGNAYCLKKSFKESESCYNEAMTIYKKSFGDSSLETAKAYHGLAETYRAQDKYEKAIPFYEKALKVREAAASEHTDLADSSLGLAECYGKLGRKADAIPLMKRVVSIQQKLLGNHDPRTAKSYFMLANLYEDTGKSQMAIPVYEQVVSVCETVYGADNPKTATTLEHLGSMYAKEKKWSKAEKSYKRALAIREKKSDSAKLNGCIKAYADVLKHDHKGDEALKLEARLKRSGAGSSGTKNKKGK